MGKTGRLNLEMNDWMGNQNKKREKLTDSDILKQFEQAEKDTRFLPINPLVTDPGGAGSFLRDFQYNEHQIIP